MKKEKNEFLGLLCNLYLLALLVALPLYTGEGYWKLGDTKYVLFRNVSYLCLGCWLVLGIPGRVRAVREWRCQRFSIVDFAVAAYGGCVVVSALCSSYGQLAWIGYNEWYMGAISQLMFVGIYFFVSRQYDGSRYPIYLGEGAFFLVTLLGLLHRVGIDPLGLKVGWNNGDWEYNHMLSTLGNINWLCGFYSVALAWLLTHFMGERKRWREVLLYLAVVATFVLLGIQGSQGGLLILGVGVVVCVWLGWGQGVIFRKLALLLAGFCACMPLIDWLTKLRKETAAVAVDGNVLERTVWYGWVMAAVACMCFYFLSKTGMLQKFGVCIKEGLRKWKQSVRKKKRQWEERKAGEGKEAKETKGADENNKILWILIFLIVIGISAALVCYLRFGINESSLPGADGGSGMSNMAGADSEGGVVSSGAEGKSGVSGMSGAGSESDVVSSGAEGKSGVSGMSGAGSESGVVSSGVDDGGSSGGLFGIDDNFGSGRGFLWRIALEGFSQADWKDKLLGAGPDCYGEAVFNRLRAGTDVWHGEHWEGAIFTNAHNEVLSQLINVGILGTISYLAIFLTGLWRYGGGRRSKRFQYSRWLGVLAIAMYGAHSLISFQQVLNTPLLFLTLGLCEYEIRFRKEAFQLVHGGGYEDE